MAIGSSRPMVDAIRIRSGACAGRVIRAAVIATVPPITHRVARPLCSMAAIRLLELLVLLSALAGFLGLLLRRNLFLKVLAMDVLGTAVVALFVLFAARSGLRSPILRLQAGATDLADPIPQAVILTAIVIGLSIQALLLVVVTQLARIDPSLDVDSFDRSPAG
jgi:multicomponent Na+:H+ antiporter subunit C